MMMKRIYTVAALLLVAALAVPVAAKPPAGKGKPAHAGTGGGKPSHAGGKKVSSTIAFVTFGDSDEGMQTVAGSVAPQATGTVIVQYFQSQDGEWVKGGQAKVTLDSLSQFEASFPAFQGGTCLFKAQYLGDKATKPSHAKESVECAPVPDVVVSPEPDPVIVP